MGTTHAQSKLGKLEEEGVELWVVASPCMEAGLIEYKLCLVNDDTAGR